MFTKKVPVKLEEMPPLAAETLLELLLLQLLN